MKPPTKKALLQRIVQALEVLTNEVRILRQTATAERGRKA